MKSRQVATYRPVMRVTVTLVTEALILEGASARKTLLAAPVSAGSVLGAAGCAGYRLGPTNGTPARSRSVEVALFPNRTLEPRLSEPVAQAALKVCALVTERIRAWQAGLAAPLVELRQPIV